MEDLEERWAMEAERERREGDRPATQGEAHAEWHMVEGWGQCCPWDCASCEVYREEE